MKKQEVKEIWAPAVYIFESGNIIEFPKYLVSNYGRVKSLDYNHTGKARVLSQCTCENKDHTIYYMVNLHKDNKRHQLLVHRLVLSSFKESDYFPGAVADHVVARTETECCDRLDNLRWITQQQNCNTEHCIDAHTNHPSLSKRVKVTNLTTCEITMYPSAMEAGRALSINPRVPSNCIKCCKGYYKKLNLHFAYV